MRLVLTRTMWAFCLAATCALTSITGALAATPADQARPAWFHWIGWSTDGRFAAWRQGHSRETNKPGTPVWLARVQANGVRGAATLSRGPVRKTLAEHGIRGRVWVWRDQITPVDVILRTRNDVLLAVVVRGVPPVLAVLRKWQGEYEVVANRAVPGPVVSINSQAFESSGGDRIAVLARTHTAQTTSAWLFTLPLSGRPVPPSKPTSAKPAPTVDAPSASTPVTTKP